MDMRKTLRSAIAALGLAAFSAASSAASLGLTAGDDAFLRDSDGKFNPGQLTAHAAGSFTGGATNWSGTIGMFDLEVSSTGTGDWQRLLTFCLEPLSTFRVDNPYAVIDDLSDDLKRMWATHRDSVVDGVTAAAFQIAIWEIVLDPGNYDLGAGNNRLTTGGSVAQAAQGFMSGWGEGMADLLRLSDNGQGQSQYQDVVLDVPLPSTLALFGVGLLGLGMVRARTKGK